MQESPANLLDFATSIASQAGDVTLEYFQTAIAVDSKADNSPVTIADRRSETLLRERISERFPSHGILGEEFGETNAGARYRWILDPIDGTLSFVRGVPLYGVMIALEEDGEPIVGVLHFPAMRETVAAARGEGCFWKDARTRVSTVDSLAHALVLATDVSAMPRYERDAAYGRLRDATRMQRTWGDCYGYALVATGRAEVMLDPIMNVWDTAALLPIMEEAGGTLTDWSGRRTHTAPEAMATNGLLFDAVVATVRGVAGD